MGKLIAFLAATWAGSWDATRSGLEWLGSWLKRAIETTLNLPAWVQKGLAILFAAGTVALGCLKAAGLAVVALIGQLSSYVSSVVGGTYSVPSVVTSALNGMNTFFPLQELFGFMTAYFALVLTCAAIRMVKAWIPTVS